MKKLLLLLAVLLLMSCGNDTKRMKHLESKFPNCRVTKEHDTIIITYPTGHKFRVKFDTFNDTLFYLSRY